MMLRCSWEFTPLRDPGGAGPLAREHSWVPLLTNTDSNCAEVYKKVRQLRGEGTEVVGTCTGGGGRGQPGKPVP